VGNAGVRGANARGAGGTGYRWHAAERRQCQVDGTGPQPGDNAEDSHRGLVMRGGRVGVPGSTTLGDAPQPWVLRRHGLGGIWHAPIRHSRPPTPGHRLEASGGRRGAHVFIGR
jgi:hypothetical protein